MKRKGYGYVGVQETAGDTKRKMLARKTLTEKCPPAKLFEQTKRWFGLKSGARSAEKKFLEDYDQTASSTAKVFSHYCQRIASMARSFNQHTGDALLKESSRLNQNILTWFDIINKDKEGKDTVRREALIYWIQVNLEELAKNVRHPVKEWWCRLTLFNYMLEKYLDPKELHRAIPSTIPVESFWEWSELDARLRSDFRICDSL